jgi:hypothetical protein
VCKRFGRFLLFCSFDALDLGFLVHGDFRYLAIVTLELQRFLLTVRRFPSHLDAAYRSAALVDHGAFDAREPTTVADTDELRDAKPGTGGIKALWGRGNHDFSLSYLLEERSS